MKRIRFLNPAPPKSMAYTPHGTMPNGWESMVGSADRKVIGGRIKMLRKARHWQQKELALMVGIRFEQLNKYESGLNTPPVDTLVKLDNALDTTVEYILTGTEIEQSNLANIRLFRRFQALENLGQDDQQTIIRLIDAFIAQHRIVAVLAPVD